MVVDEKRVAAGFDEGGGRWWKARNSKKSNKRTSCLWLVHGSFVVVGFNEGRLGFVGGRRGRQGWWKARNTMNES